VGFEVIIYISSKKFTYWCALRIAFPHLIGVLSEILGGKRRTIINFWPLKSCDGMGWAGSRRC
jgi:hypothetical protein